MFVGARPPDSEAVAPESAGATEVVAAGAHFVEFAVVAGTMGAVVVSAFGVAVAAADQNHTSALHCSQRWPQIRNAFDNHATWPPSGDDGYFVYHCYRRTLEHWSRWRL